VTEDEADALPLEVVDPDVRGVLGLFDVPAFARRGAELESSIERLHARIRHGRSERLEMVRMRLRQWAAAAAGPGSWRLVFEAPLDELWTACAADPPEWSAHNAPPRRLRAIGRDLVRSIERYNGRWMGYLQQLNLTPLNETIEQYNAYYVLEKECVLGSARLAARYFVPRVRVTVDDLLAAYPPLAVPALANRGVGSAIRAD
jgi:hypothetical protein